MLQRINRVLGVAAALLSLSDVASSQNAPIFGSRKYAPAFFTIDRETGQATLASDNITVTMTSMARHPVTGLVYYIGNVDPNPVAVWDPSLDTETIINPASGQQLHRMGFNWIGDLYGMKLNSRRLFRVNTVTGEMIEVGDLMGVPTAGSSGDISFPPGETNVFYYLAGQDLYRVDIRTLSGTLVGPTGMGFEGVGLGFDADGRLFGCTAYNFFELDPSSGAATFIGVMGAKMNDLGEAIEPRELVLQVNDNTLNVGDTISLTTFGGMPGGGTLLAVVMINATPSFLSLRLGLFDGAGQWNVSGPVSPGVAGIDLTFRVYGIAADGFVAQTNDRRVQFDP